MNPLFQPIKKIIITYTQIPKKWKLKQNPTEETKKRNYKNKSKIKRFSPFGSDINNKQDLPFVDTQVDILTFAVLLKTIKIKTWEKIIEILIPSSSSETLSLFTYNTRKEDKEKKRTLTLNSCMAFSGTEEEAPISLCLNVSLKKTGTTDSVKQIKSLNDHMNFV